jgi:hypothetical protein
LTFSSFTPIVGAMFRDLKDLTHEENGKHLAMLMNKPECY